MKKRTFLKLSSALITGTVFSPMNSWSQDNKLKNWAGNLEYGTSRLDHPETVVQIQELVKKYNKLKVLGTRHCFNRIADSTEHLISSGNLNQVISLDKQALTVTAGAGIRYGQLAEYLNNNGFALHNLASLPHISVAGACATATHGSGNLNGNLATAVSAMEMINAAGDLITISKGKNQDEFEGMIVALGALGVITKVTLHIQPTFMVRQDVYENLSMDRLKGHFDEIMSSGYSVSLFTNWQKKNFSEVWIKRRINGEKLDLQPEFYGATPATRNLHPIIDLSAENCTEQMGVPGPWHERLPHFRMGFTPSSGKELQTEYFVPRQHAYEAILAVEQIHEQVSPYLMISEIRTVAADNLWMSPCYQQDSATIHFTWKQDWPAVRKLLPVIEKQLAPFSARPHWGKLFTMSPQQLKSLYKRLPDFQRLIAKYDPKGKFRNEFLSTYI